MKKYNWGIIGPGKIARRFASDLQLLDNAVVYGVASRNMDRARQFASEYEVEAVYDDYEALIADPVVDIIYVATPHHLHKELTIACLQAKVPVLCEKPIGLNLAEVEEMISLAREKQVFLMEAMWTACLPHYLYVKDLVAKKTFGAIKKLTSDFGFMAEYDPDGRLFNKALGGGSLMDIGIYPVYAAVSLLGNPKTCQASAVFTDSGVDAELRAKLGYADDVIAALHSSFLAHTPTQTTVECEEATIRIKGRWHEPTDVEIIQGEVVETKTFETQGAGYQYEAAEAMRCLEAGLTESPLMSLDETWRLATLIDRIQQRVKLFYN